MVMNMSSYNYTTLAILDYKIDELINQKTEIDNRLTRLYEVREEVVVAIEEDMKPCKCNGECK